VNDPRLTVQTSKVQLKDSSGTEVGTDTNPVEVESRDYDSYSVFGDILTELKKMNIQLSILTDQIIRDLDVQ
jgi:hypothetical protein